jgi:catechol 2,3-dioxygenase-like lactoylglutathione lyase family enzyme
VDLKINRIQHVGLPVTDLPASEAFYAKLGFANVMASGFDFQGGRGAVAMMRRGAMILELYQMPEAQLREIRNRKDGHIDHVAFDVDSIEETFTALKNGGFAVVEDAPVFLPFWNKGCKYFNILGPDGERLEFNQIL